MMKHSTELFGAGSEKPSADTARARCLTSHTCFVIHDRKRASEAFWRSFYGAGVSNVTLQGENRLFFRAHEHFKKKKVKYVVLRVELCHMMLKNMKCCCRLNHPTGCKVVQMTLSPSTAAKQKRTRVVISTQIYTYSGTKFLL